QARLVLYFGKSAEAMRNHGVRTISDLKMLDDAAALELAEKTSATKAAVEMARRRAQEDGAVDFLESLRRTLVAGHALKKCPEVLAETVAEKAPPLAIADGAERVVSQRPLPTATARPGAV